MVGERNLRLAALAALLAKRWKMYYGRAGGHWALRQELKRW